MKTGDIEHIGRDDGSRNGRSPEDVGMVMGGELCMTIGEDHDSGQRLLFLGVRDGDKEYAVAMNRSALQSVIGEMIQFLGKLN